MTTIRKLIMEMGITGDLDVKTKLNDIQNSANGLKHTLEELEIQLTTLGKASPTTKSYGLFGSASSSSIVTTSERRAAEKTEKAIRESAAAEKERSIEQIDLSKQMVKALKDQVAGQEGLIKRAISESNVEIQALKGIAIESAKFIRDLEPIIKRAKSRGTAGTAFSIQKDKSIERKFKSGLMARGEGITSEIDALVGEKSIFATEMQVESSLLQIKSKKAIKEIQKKGEVRRKATLFAITEEFELNPFEAVSTQTSKQAIAEAGKEIFESPEIIYNEQKAMQMAAAGKELNKKRVIEKEITSNTQKAINQILANAAMDSNRSVIAAEISNERERSQLQEKAGEIREEIEFDFGREDLAKKRGFAFLPVENLLKKQRDMQKRVKQTGEKVKGKFADVLAKSRFFQTAKQFAGGKNEGKEERAQEIIDKPSSQKIINIAFNGLTVDNEERKNEIVNAVTLALRGI